LDFDFVGHSSFVNCWLRKRVKVSAASGISDVSRREASQSLGGLFARRLRGVACSPLLHKSGLSVLDQAVVSGTSFATSVLLARSAPREELGVYYLALSVIFFVRGIQEQLVSGPYMIYCGRKRGEQLAEYGGSALIHECVVLLATSIALVAALFAGMAPGGAEAAFWLLTVAAPLILMREFVRHMLFAHLEIVKAIAVDLAAAALQIAALTVLAVAGRLNVSLTIGVLAVASGLPAIAWLAMKPQPLVGHRQAAIRDLAHNWIFARWALASQLLACTTPYVMPWIVAVTHGASQTGLLGACTTLVGLSNIFLMGLCNFLSPQAARAFTDGGLAELKSVLKKTSALFGVTLGGLAVVAFLIGEKVAVLVYGAQFSGSGPVIGVLSLSVLANSFGVTAGNGLWAMERPKANFVADLCSLAVVVVVTILCVPQWGPMGAALATLSGTTTDALVRLWILRQTMREHAVGTVIAKEAA
jgi:O-antigen/teichoic acid export membrane protein